MKKIEQLRLPNGKEPYIDWFNTLDESLQAKVTAYIDRVAAGGSKKNIRPLGNQIFEIKLRVSPGYRVYFGELEGTIILLLLAGDKSSQKKDIDLAKKYWRNYVQK